MCDGHDAAVQPRTMQECVWAQPWGGGTRQGWAGSLTGGLLSALKCSTAPLATNKWVLLGHVTLKRGWLWGRRSWRIRAGSPTAARTGSYEWCICGSFYSCECEGGDVLNKAMTGDLRQLWAVSTCWCVYLIKAASRLLVWMNQCKRRFDLIPLINCDGQLIGIKGE